MSSIKESLETVYFLLENSKEYFELLQEILKNSSKRLGNILNVICIGFYVLDIYFDVL